jgi:uncharacterized membrane protein
MHLTGERDGAKPGSSGAADTVSDLEARARRDRSFPERIATLANQAAGSMTFVVLHLVWFAAWIAVNLDLVPGTAPFDPFPFGFLAFLVSLEAIFLSLLVLMAQNRMTKEADRRAVLDLEINILAEQEGTKILATLQRVAAKLGIEDSADEEARELAGPTNVSELAEVLEEELP